VLDVLERCSRYEVAPALDQLSVYAPVELLEGGALDQVGAGGTVTLTTVGPPAVQGLGPTASTASTS
jgi:hypothetical protein